MRSPTLSALLHAQPDRAFQVLQRPVAAEMQRVNVRRQQLFLALVLLADQLLDRLDVHVEQRRQRADIDDVLEQLALARIAVGRVGDRGERHADHVDVLAELRGRHRLGGIVEQVAAGLDRGDVLVPGLRVHRDHHVDAAARAEMAVLGDAHLVPGRQALDVGREDVARRTGTPMRRMERANSSFALAEPEPLTLAKRMTKSFTLLIGLAGMACSRGSCR